MTNTERDLVDTYCAALDQLGIKYNVYEYKPRQEGWSMGWNVTIRGRTELSLFREKVTLGSDRKRTLLDHALSSYVRAERKHYVARNERPIEDIRAMRGEGKTHAEIAAELGMNRRTVTRWCNEEGIS